MGTILQLALATIPSIALGAYGYGLRYVVALAIGHSLLNVVGLLIDNLRGRQAASFGESVVASPLAVGSTFALVAPLYGAIYILSAFVSGNALTL